MKDRGNVLFWKNSFRIAWAIPVALFMNAYRIISQKMPISVSSLLLSTLYSEVSAGDTKTYYLVMENLIYIVIFQILFGNYMYQYFENGGVYVFVRLKDRKKWFFKRSLEILTLALGYILLFLTVTTMICFGCSTQPLADDTLAIYFVFLTGMLTFFLASTTILINLLSVLFGSAIGFFSVFLAMALFCYVGLACAAHPFLIAHPLAAQLNPMNCIIMKVLSEPLQGFLVIGYQMGLGILVTAIGAVKINHMDIYH